MPDILRLTGAELSAPVVQGGARTGSVTFRFVSAVPVAVEIEVASIVHVSVSVHVIERDVLAAVRVRPVRVPGLTIDATRGVLAFGLDLDGILSIARVPAVDVERFLDFTYELVPIQDEGAALTETIDRCADRLLFECR